LFGVFWGWLFLDEHVSMTMIAGGVLVLMGSALMHLKKSD
jgi:drug/metabolite transporter (DMT)-like permease